MQALSFRCHPWSIGWNIEDRITKVVERIVMNVGLLILQREMGAIKVRMAGS